VEKTKKYAYRKFSNKALRATAEMIIKLAGDDAQSVSRILEVSLDKETWKFDDLEEFLADYKDAKAGMLALYLKMKDGKATWTHRLHLMLDSTGMTMIVQAPQRSEIAQVFNVFESYQADSSDLTPPQKPLAQPVIFIGHGRSADWRELKDHLQDKHGCKVDAFEVGARAGHSVRDILEKMLVNASIAFLVFTAEDETIDGQLRARQNVVHETGLFQGKLGFARAIVLLENGVEEFSNLQGIQQLRFDHDQIQSTFGDVLAVIKREFGKS
jgi:predicted nucleotide-binding protein